MTPLALTPLALTPDEERQANADSEPANIPVWFFNHGVRVFPIIPGTKEPACKWKDYHGTREQAARFTSYGVHLVGLLVVDADSAAAREWIALHIPPTPFRVTTGPYHDGTPGRGAHHIFRTTGPLPKFIHRDGLTIESRNEHQYVLGSGSQHPSGMLYTPFDWSWQWEDIPFFPLDFLFDDGSCGPRLGASTGERFEFPKVVAAGERHDVIYRYIRSLKWYATIEEAHEAVSLVNEACCQPPLVEDEVFERWFTRAWNQPDRPFPADAPSVPSVPSVPRLPRLTGGLSWR